MSDDDKIRLLICFECKTIEPLKDYRGDPRQDVELAALVKSKHTTLDRLHVGQLADAPLDAWGMNAKREEILRQLQAKLDAHGGETGLGSGTYAMVDTFKDDAMACFQQHLRNPNCSDYKSDSKRLIPDTAAERRELGLVEAKNYDREGGQKTIYLCDYCPVQSMVEQAARKKAGMYDR